MFAQIIEQGSTWDKEFVGIGEMGEPIYKITSTPPRLINNDGEYTEYVFTDSLDTLQVETLHGSVSLDKSSCEFAFYKNQINSSIPIFIDDIEPRVSVGGVSNWVAIPQLNNAACVPTFDEDTLTLSAKKIHTEGIIEYKYQSANLKWKTQLEITNLSTDTDRTYGFVQVFDVTDDNIKIGNAERKLGDSVGVKFDREFLQNNNASVLDLLNGVKFDFDIGFDNLGSIEVLSKNPNSAKIQFDYSRALSPLLPNQTLVIDPAIVLDAGAGGTLEDTDNNGACDTFGTLTTTTFQFVRVMSTASTDDCYIADIEFVLPGTATNATSVSAVTIDLEVDLTTNDQSYDFKSIDLDDLSTRTGAQRFTSVQAGSDYISAVTVPSVALQTFTLNSVAHDDVLANLQGGGGEFSVGIEPSTFVQGASNKQFRFNSVSGTNPPEISITYSSAPPPDSVDDLVSDLTTASTVDLNWSEPGLNGFPLVNYLVNSTTPTGDPLTFVGNTTSSFYNVTGLAANTAYSFRTSALTEGGYNTTGSTILNVTTHNTQPPTGLTADTISLSEILLSWIAPASGDAPNGYKIQRESPTGGGWSVLIANTTDTSVTHTDTGLTSATQYNYKVSTLSTTGESVPTAGVANYTWGVPQQVTGLTVGDTSSTSLTLDWTAPGDNGFAITGYKIERESPTGAGFTTLVSDTGSTAVSYVNTGLTPMTQYNYKVSAINSQGTGTASNAGANYTLPDFPILLVVNPEGTSTTDLNLEWTEPAVNFGINGYKIERAPSVGGTFAVINANTTNTNTYYNDTGLAINTYYNYRVSSLGNLTSESSIPSNTYSQTTYHLPDSVDDLTATASGFGSALLEWTVPDTLYGYILGYMINYTTPPADPLTIYVNSTGTSDVSAIVGLPINDYSFRVSAVTIHGTNVSAGLIANLTTIQSTTLGDLDVDFSEQQEAQQVPITFTLHDINATQSVLQVNYDSTMDLDCNFAYKYARSNTTYGGLVETPISGTSVYTNFTLNDPANEIIDVNCIDSINSTNTGFFQISLAEIPFFEMADNFSGGLYGTQGFFGFFDLITLLAVIVSMIGFNRYNPAVGVVLMLSMLGALAYYELIELSGLILGVLALMVVLAIGTVKKT